MGFEITYYYKDASDTPGVYQDEVLMKTTKIGKFDEDVPLETLAGKIIAQLARRNILIVDIEIFEYTKKKISYKETQNGITIKNKKFSFDTGAPISASSEEDEELSRILEDESLVSKLKNALMPNCSSSSEKKNICVRSNKTDGKKPIRSEVYDPEMRTKIKVEQKGYKFTVGRKYPIFSEKSLAGQVNYITKDDSGREVEVGADCFIVPPIGLSFDDPGPQYFGEANEEVNLWKNVSVDDNMPEIRR
jgi:hypothetical protein